MKRVTQCNRDNNVEYEPLIEHEQFYAIYFEENIYEYNIYEYNKYNKYITNNIHEYNKYFFIYKKLYRIINEQRIN